MPRGQSNLLGSPRVALAWLCAGWIAFGTGLGFAPTPCAAEGSAALDSAGLILALSPAPGAEGIDAGTSVEIHLAAEPLLDTPDETPWWRLYGRHSGPRTAADCELTIAPDAGATGGFLLRLTTTRPFVAGEEVCFTLRQGWPLHDGRELSGLFSTFRVAPAQMTLRPAATPEPLPLQTRSLTSLFADSQRLEVGAGPNMAVAADLNQDGMVDLVVAEVMGDDSINIFLNNGAGRLARHASLQIEGLVDPARFAIDDLNHDSWLDIVVIGQRSGNLVVLEGDGEGDFTAGTLIDLHTETPVHVSVADLDLDGNQDILVTQLGGDTITLLRGDPEQAVGFAAEEQIPALPDVQALVVTDLDANLTPDVALVSERNNTVGVLLGGDQYGSVSNLTASFAVPTGRRPKAVVAGDLNNDGHTDLVVTQEGSNDVAVFLGRGDGTFETPQSHPVGDRPVIPALVDLNGDGNLDLAVPNLFSDNVTLLIGAGDGTFSTSENLPVDAGPVAIAAADFDDDGDVDLAVVNSVADNVTIYFSRQSEVDAGTGTLEPRSLGQNIPNPFNPNTTISYTLLEPSHVNLVVFNTSGKVVRTLVNELHAAGQHSSFWDGTDEANVKVPSGIYFYRLTTDETVELRRMTLIR